MKTIGSFWAALAMAPCVLFVGGAAGAAEPHWSEGAVSPSGEPMVWLPNCSQELAKLGLKRCFSSRLVPQSYAQERLVHVHEALTRESAPRGPEASSCGASNSAPGTPVTTVPVGLGANGLAKAYLLDTPGLPT